MAFLRKIKINQLTKKCIEKITTYKFAKFAIEKIKRENRKNENFFAAKISNDDKKYFLRW